MSIEFSQPRWQKVKDDARKWWAGDLGRPLIQARLSGKQPGRSASSVPYHDFTSFYDLSISAEDVADAWDYQLCCTEHMGDAYPHVVPNFGPGSIAAYMGAKLENGTDTVWFHPDKELEISQLDFEYISDNNWLVRTKEVIQAAVNRWAGKVQVGLTDLPGNVSSLVVTIREIRVVPAGQEDEETDAGLPLIATFADPQPIDIMQLQYQQQLLGENQVPAGAYSQVRLVLEPNPADGPLVN